MFITNNIILDLPLDPSLEADLIWSLKSEGTDILFSVESYLDEQTNEYKPIHSFKTRDGKRIDISAYIKEKTTANFMGSPFYDNTPIEWFSIASKSMLVEIIAASGLFYSCYICNNEKSIVDYETEIIVNEHLMYQDKEYRGMIINKSKTSQLTTDIEEVIKQLLITD